MKIIALSRHALGFCASIALLTACGGGSGPVPQIGAVPRTALKTSTPSFRFHLNLYVLNSEGSFGSSVGDVAIYGLEHGEQQEAISEGVDRPDAMAVASKGDLLVANTRPSERDSHVGSVTKYDRGGYNPSLVLDGTVHPDAVVLDSSNNVYVANQWNLRMNDSACRAGSVDVYRPGAALPVLRISGYVNRPIALAHDNAGNLYVANALTINGSCKAGNSIMIFRPRSSAPAATITQGLFYPRAMAIDSGLLYVANAPPSDSKTLPFGSVAVFQLGSDKLLRIITSGIDTPAALAVDGNGYLYVANLNGHSVSVYAPGATTPSRIISQGVNSPYALAIGSKDGDLYVANIHQNNVSAYAPGQIIPRLIISQGVRRPVSLAVAP